MKILHPAGAAAAESETTIERFRDQSRATKQHVRNLLVKNRESLPDHIKEMFDTADSSAGKRAANNELIDQLFCKKNGKWEMTATAPYFEQAKVRCYIYRNWNLNHRICL